MSKTNETTPPQVKLTEDADTMKCQNVEIVFIQGYVIKEYLLSSHLQWKKLSLIQVFNWEIVERCYHEGIR